MEANSESSQQANAENVKIINVDDQIQSMKKKFSQYNVEDQMPIVACNYRVPDKFRKGNEYSYTPRVVSIGPIHHGKPHLQAMERSKWKFVGRYLERSSSLTFDDMVQVAIDIEEEARMSYLESFDNISSQEFSEMIILDFIFLIELIFKINHKEAIPFGQDMILDITHDMVLLENQLPQQLVTRLFRKLYKEHNLGDLILECFRHTTLAKSLNASSDDWNSATDMLDFLVMCHDSKTESTFNSEIVRKWTKRTHSATELREAGVKFSKVDNADFLFDVKFVNGVLQMPVIEMDILIEARFLNMIASEQSKRDKLKRVSGYVFLLANLIKSPKDVVLLSNYGIIQHRFNDDDQVRSLFHNVANGVIIDARKCYFRGLYMEMHAYSRNNWHQWKGSWFKWKRVLREDYFSNPWTIISVIAAFILLVLTVIQTVCAIIQL